LQARERQCLVHLNDLYGRRIGSCCECQHEYQRRGSLSPGVVDVTVIINVTIFAFIATLSLLVITMCRWRGRKRKHKHKHNRQGLQICGVVSLMTLSRGPRGLLGISCPYIDPAAAWQTGLGSNADPSAHTHARNVIHSCEPSWRIVVTSFFSHIRLLNTRSERPVINLVTSAFGLDGGNLT
jgi:hypothetical protein